MHTQQLSPTQLLEAGHRAEVEGRFDLAAQFYRHLTEHHAFTGEAAEARNGLGRVGAAQTQIWHANGAVNANGATRTSRRRPVAPRDHYRIGRMLALSISALGWLAVLGGLACPALYVGLDAVVQSMVLPRVGLPWVLIGAASMIAGGLLIVVAGQIARAVFDQANATRDLVALERAKFGAD